MSKPEELRQLADKFSEGWHEGIKIDAMDVMLLSDAAEEIDRLRAEVVTMHEALKYVQDFERNRGGNWFDLREIVDEALTRPNADVTGLAPRKDDK